MTIRGVRPPRWHDGRMGDRLVLVEDDDGIRTALRLALSDAGYEVAEAAMELLNAIVPAGHMIYWNANCRTLT